MCNSLLSVLFDSLAAEYGPKQGPGYGPREDVHLLKTVLQDSINLLEQVGYLNLDPVCRDGVPKKKKCIAEDNRLILWHACSAR